MANEKVLESKLRRFTPEKLKALKVIAESSMPITCSGTVGHEVGLDSQALGGVLSGLSRTAVGSEPLIKACGFDRKTRGIMWKLNTDVAPKAEVIKIANEVLGDLGET